jgi:EmrB/QacA subfamily drug resistance transporter
LEIDMTVTDLRIGAADGLTGANRRWWTLAGACTGLFVLMLDSTMINVALPDVARDLDATTAGLQWVMNAYLLALAAFVVSAGRLGDVLGRRRVFVVGMAAFACGSVVAALSGSEQMLVVGRVLQGLGGAALLGLSLAIVSSVFEAGERPRALGIWAGVSAVGLGLGPLLGGALVEAVSWRWLFWVNLPFCLLGAVLVLASTAEQRDESAARRIDIFGVITVGLGLAAIVTALVEGKAWGPTSPATLGVFAVGVGLLVGFWLIEHSVRSPLVEFDLFRNGPYVGACAAGFSLVGCYWAVMFLQPQYLQSELGNSALEAGVLILPVTAPMIVISPLAGRLTGLIGVRALMTVGMALGTTGLVVLAQVDASGGYAHLLPGYLLFGIALGCVFAPMSTAAMTAMPQAKAGIAAGVLAMNRIMAGAITLAAAGAVFQAVLDDDLHAAHAEPAAFTSAISAAMWLLVGLCAIGTVLTWAFVRASDDTPVALEHHAHRHPHLPWVSPLLAHGSWPPAQRRGPRSRISPPDHPLFHPGETPRDPLTRASRPG